MRKSSLFILVFIFFFCSSIFGSYFLLNLSNTTFNSLTYDDSSPKFGNLPLNSKESILNQTYYFWNGSYSSTLGISGNWNGRENYTLISPVSYSVSERDSYSGAGLVKRNINDMNRLIADSTNLGWVNGTHEPFWIFTNVSLGETVLVAGHTFVSGLVKPGDFSLNVSKKENITHLSKQYECWKLTNGPTSAYYDQTTGCLVEGHFEFNFLSWVFRYNISMVTTNAKPLPNIGILTPAVPIIFSSNIPIVVTNYTVVDTVWCRNSSNGGISWSNNLTLSYNGSHYINSTTLHWEHGTYILQVFANNTNNFTRYRNQYFTAWTVGPYIQITSPLNTSYLYRKFEVHVINYTHVNAVWYRFKNDTSWTNNITLAFNGSLFKDDTIFWANGNYNLQAFANDSAGRISLQNQWFTVAATLPFNLSSNYLTDQEAKIVLDSNQCIHIVWIRNSSSTWEVVYDNNVNGHFGNAITIFSSSNSLALGSLNIVIDPSNTIHVCWLEITPSYMSNLYYVKKQGSSFGVPTAIPTTGFDLFLQVSLAVDSAGRAYLALTGINMLLIQYALYYTNNLGGTFSIPTAIYMSSIPMYLDSVIGVDSTFRVHLFWIDNTTGNFDIFYKNDTGGGFTGSPVQISTHRDSDRYPTLAIDSIGILHLTWMALNNANYDIMYVNNSGGYFHNPVNVTKTTDSTEMLPRISVDTGTNPDSVYLIYANYIQNQAHPFVSDNRKGEFCRPRSIYDPSNNTTYVDLAVLPFEGLTYIVWNGNDANDYEAYFTEDYSPISLFSPQNRSYSYQNIPLKVVNSSRHLTQVWCRNRTSTGPWSANYTLTWNGVYFSNSSTVIWPIGFVTVQTFSNDSNGRFFSEYEYLIIDTTPPIGYQWLNTSSKVIQRTNLIWINGTAWDPSPGSGIKSITLTQSNTSSSWSSNVGFQNNFAFYNISPIADNRIDGCYIANITILDNSDNSFRIACNITVEINPPSGAQDPSTQNPQNGGIAHLIWINGTSSDSGFGVASVVIQSTNHSGNPWSVQIGTNSNWSFNNISAIENGAWEIIVNMTDFANNSASINCYIFVDWSAPTGSQSTATDISHPQNNAPGFIWVNGTCTDASGIGILNVALVGTNHTGNPWNVNQGTNESWAFNNISAINEGCWEVIVQLTDKLGNSRNISCFIFVDTISPTATQDIQTQAFQKPDQLGSIWINGTANDSGSGLLSVVVLGSNYTGALWSVNLNTNESWIFNNLTVISDGIWEIYIQITDRASNFVLITAYIRVDTSAPSSAQDFITISPQNAKNGFIWVNGTATDASGVGILNVAIVGTNHTGMPWSSNLGTNLSWAFNNISAIEDGSWSITINLIDALGNSRNITCYITVDTTAPWGVQDIPTQLPQKTDISKLIWVNGTATDGTGLGILNVSIVWTNSSALWSVNLNTNTSWAFNNATAILDGVWQIRITFIDHLYNARNLTCFIVVDTRAPTASQNPNTNGSVLQESNYIWINGTASDGSGSGIPLVSIVTGTGNAPNTWSMNQGSNTNWAFTNTSAIQSDQTYWVMVNVTDLAGNMFLLNCTFRVEVNPPEGAQDAATLLPQNGGVTHLIWINGTAFDGGSGVKNATVSNTNITGGATFSSNLGTPEHWTFQNSSVIPDGAWTLIITIFDNTGHSVNVTGYIFVDTIPPAGSQSASTSLSVIQKGWIIWINGSALDTSPSSGIQSISIFQSNTTGGLSDWGANVGDNSNWAFYNISPLADNYIDGCYQINITIIDNAGNRFLLNCKMIVEISLPYGSQNANSKSPQKSDANNWIWINGTAFDTGFGVASITIHSTNHTGNPWNTNSGTTANWAFNNGSAINNGRWEIWLNITDLANNSALIQCVIFVDYAPPTGWQSISTDINHPQNGGLAKLIFINGTASDGIGVGVSSVSIIWTNGTALWSSNYGTNANWAFQNMTSIADGIWEFRILLSDLLNNSRIITCVIILDTIAPSQPNVSIPVVSGSNVLLNWDPVLDQTGVTYYVYRNGNLIGTTPATSYSDTNLAPGTYNYTIVPVDGAGNIGTGSANMTATVEGAPFDWIIILIIILAAGIIGVSSVITISRKRKRQPVRRTP